MREIDIDLEGPQSPNLEKPLGGRYKIVQNLGIGGFSQTFIAEDCHLPDCPPCVIKQLKPHFESEQDLQTARRLFDTEAKVLYKLGRHDQIPRLLAHFEENHQFYLAQELVEGETLNHLLIDYQPWPEADVIALLRDVLNVLAFVHAQGVIHRDIKPSNLIQRKSDGKIILIDFGAVKQVSLGVVDGKSGKTDLTISVGTQGYTANEQLAGEPYFSSDIYSLGMVAIQALTGVRPKHFKKNPCTHEFQWCQEGISVSQELVSLLDYMVCYDFRARYATASEALAALQTLPTYYDGAESSPDAPTRSELGQLPVQLLLPPVRDNLTASDPSQRFLNLSGAQQPVQSTHSGPPTASQSRQRSPNQPFSPQRSTEQPASLNGLLKRLVSIRGLVAVGFVILMANALLTSQSTPSASNQKIGVSSTPLSPQDPSDAPPSIESPPNESPSSDASLAPPPSFGAVQRVPAGLFNYGGSTTWALIRREVDPILQASQPTFKLRYTHPVTGKPGSNTGIRMLLEGQLAFSQSSRPLEDAEYQEAQQQGISLKQIPVALEGIAIVVHPSLAIPGLNLSQLQGIYTGKIVNWKEVGGPNRAITPYSRLLTDSGTVEFFVKNVLNGNLLGGNVRYVDNTTVGVQKVTNDPGSVYFTSAPEAVTQCGVKALPLARESTEFVSPYQQPLVPAEMCGKQKNRLNVEVFKTGEYPITRQLFVIVRQDQQIAQQAGEAYANLLLTNEGQELVAKSGFVRIR
jgi:serine/threonine protein kinase